MIALPVPLINLKFTVTVTVAAAGPAAPESESAGVTSHESPGLPRSEPSTVPHCQWQAGPESTHPAVTRTGGMAARS